VKRLISSLVLLGTVACTVPSASPPQGASVILTSGVESTPYTVEELAIPALKESIENCERQGHARCDIKELPLNDLSEFDRAVHSEVRTLVQLSGVQSNRTYAVEWKLYNPNGDLFRRLTLSQTVSTSWHPSYSLDYWFNWEPIDQASWQLGRWRTEIFVNVVLETERSFEVIDREDTSKREVQLTDDG